MKRLFLAIALPAQLIVSSNCVSLKFETPAAGSYQVATTRDFLHWRIVASNHEKVPVHVTAVLPKDQPTVFYAVTFQP